MAKHGSFPHQIIEILPTDANKPVKVESYYNFDELASVEAQIVGETAETKNTFVKMKINDYEVFGDAGVPVQFIEGNSFFAPGQRGFRFGDFYPDIPVAKAKGAEMTFYVSTEVAPSDSFTKIRLILTYKGKNENNLS